MPDNTIFKDRTDADAKTSPATIQKWGGLASFLLAAAFIVPGFIYLTGNLREANGPLVYALADFLYGPVWAASLITAVLALRERLGGHAPRRMSLALGAALLAAAAMVAVAVSARPTANTIYFIPICIWRTPQRFWWCGPLS
ncbi:MAG: hypothetical protein HC875_41700 [Anaerolineales bacterium]|nr:hypothetical protein [Anaerolineales bacterium]